MPVVARTSDGKLRSVLIRDVRVFPDFEDSLLSVRQLWRSGQARVAFDDECCISVSDDESPDGLLRMPFEDASWTYEWHVVGTAGLQSDQSGRACQKHCWRKKLCLNTFNTCPNTSLTNPEILF